MQGKHWNRRKFLATGALAEVSLLTKHSWASAGKPEQVLNSAGTEPPSLPAPLGTADCHHHLYDPHYAFAPGVSAPPPRASVADYRLLEKRLGFNRNVIVQPSQYGEDNSLLMAAIETLGRKHTRGIVCIPATVSDSELKQMQGAGVCGVRFDFMRPANPPSWNTLEEMAKRFAPLGWHVEISAKAGDMLANRERLERLPCPVVFEHLARVPAAASLRDQVFALACELMTRGNAWCKLTFDVSGVGPPAYTDTVAVATDFARQVPNRLVWGTNWPHPQLKQKPNDAVMFDLLKQVAPDGELLKRILADNAAQLYGF